MSTIILARESFDQHDGVLVRPGQDLALCLLVLDCSGSMQAHGDAPRLTANEIISTVRTTPGANHTMFGLITFNSSVSLDIRPVRASLAPDLATYVAEGGTALFRAVHDALSIGLELRGRAQSHAGINLRAAISVISDGQDTMSQNLDDETRALATIARGYGFALQAIGLGINAKLLAQLLGFEEGLAETVPADPNGFERTVMHTSNTFTGTMTGRDIQDVLRGIKRDTPTPR